MKASVVFFLACLLLTGRASTGPAVSKSDFGNLEINLISTGTESQQLVGAELHLDGVFIGNLTSRLPVIHAKRGQRIVKVVCPGYKVYEKKITVLGDPNHQVLNVVL
jgi:hypothetical protein